MQSITPRVPDIDWSKGFDRHWCSDSAAATHWFNAISFLLPAGEKFFRDTVRDVARDVDLSGNRQLEQDVRDFSAQEAIHAAQHLRFNQELERQGFRNIAGPTIEWWQAFLGRHGSPLTNLALVCAYEHYTAIFADYMLSTERKWMRKAPDMALLWGWHAMEEIEHKSVCFDPYHLAGGGWLRRVVAFVAASIALNVLLFGRQYLYMLRRDRQLDAIHGQARVAARADLKSALIGPASIDVRALLGYLRPSFHPRRHENRTQVAVWLAANEGRLRVIRRPAAA